MINPVNHPSSPSLLSLIHSLRIHWGLPPGARVLVVLDALEQVALAVRVTHHLVIIIIIMEKWNRDPRDSAAIEI